jgi:UDP-N-acetylmuramate: L-alanyl-gamma-D-glutamyl-meso-diaminopimelate ligase
LIGGVAENFGTSFHVQQGTLPFLLEGDEYDTAFFDKGPKCSSGLYGVHCPP